MPPQNAVEALVALLAPFVAAHSDGDAGVRSTIHALGVQLPRATAFLDGRHPELALPSDAQQMVIGISQIGQAIAADGWADRIETLAEATNVLEQALIGTTQDLDAAKVQLGEHLDAHHQSLENVQQDAAKALVDAATEIQAAGERLEQEIVAPVLTKAHGEAERIVRELIDAAVRLLREVVRGLTDHVASAELALVRAEAAIGQGLHDLEAAARHRLNVALNDVGIELANAITVRVAAVVQQELAAAIQTLAVGQALTAALASTGPWLALIHAAKEALDLLG